MPEVARAASILVVDDEPDVARIMAINLEMEGYQVRMAYNGRQALDEVARSKPDCILLDIMMPEIDGWEVMRILKADPRTEDIPIIVVTARSTDVDQIKGISGGAVEYVTKPFDPHELTRLVARALKPRDEQAEEERRKERIRKLQLSTIYDITEALISTLEIEEVLEIIAEKLLMLFDLDLCGISLLEPTGKDLRLACGRSSASLSGEDVAPLSVSLARLEEILPMELSLISGPQPVSIPDFTAGEGGTFIRHLQSLYLLPLRAKGKFTGVIFLGKRSVMHIGEIERDLLTAIGNEAAMAIENTRLYDNLRYDEEVHRELLQRVITAQEDERRRVAVELHDGIVQNIVSALYRLQLCSARLEDAPGEVREALQEALDIVNASIAEIRRVIAGLRPAMLDELGLVTALERYVESLQRKTPFPMSIKLVEGETPQLSPDAETTLFRIAQEGLNNAIKHSQCREAVLSVGVKDGELYLTVEDDGVGFDIPSLQRRATHSFGLVGMRERAQSLGGTLEVDSSPMKGTRITARFPLQIIQKEV
jgi:signal transduction histidine kinase/FixJ family two-component response regulator